MKIANVVDDLAGGKLLTDLGTEMKNTAKSYATSLNGNTLKTNLAKWGLVPAVAGVGVGSGVGLGSMAASAGIQNAFGLDFSTAAKATESAKKLSGWVIAGIVAVVVVVVILPRFRRKK
jgi:hypothetical protein